jgi:hypothetical protein
MMADPREFCLGASDSIMPVRWIKERCATALLAGRHRLPAFGTLSINRPPLAPITAWDAMFSGSVINSTECNPVTGMSSQERRSSLGRLLAGNRRRDAHARKSDN